ARGLSEVEPDLLDLVKSLRGSRWTLFRKIQLPGSLPYVFSGMKVGAILAVAGAIVGEFIASERGLGYLMIQVQSSLDTPAMVMAVGLLTLLGVALYGLVLGLERLFVVRDIRLQEETRRKACCSHAKPCPRRFRMSPRATNCCAGRARVVSAIAAGWG